tara:strand:+ start:713 stop:1054 length:342 start_codon:yes stop_codon:yes gene_type:complete
MRVKITYSVELDEVEQELSEISTNVIDKIRNVAEKIDKSFNLLLEDGNSYGRSSLLIDEARKSLAGADATLADLQTIIAALQVYYEGDKNVRDRRPGMDTTRNLSDEKKTSDR